MSAAGSGAGAGAGATAAGSLLGAGVLVGIGAISCVASEEGVAVGSVASGVLEQPATHDIATTRVSIVFMRAA